MERIILVTSRRHARGGDLLGQLTGALAGAAPGTTLIEVREKDLGGRELGKLGAAVLEIARVRGARVVVNDRADVALAIGADGVHLPEDGMSVEEARSLLPPGSLVGASVHGVEGARRRSGADYLMMGPVWETPGKTASGLATLVEVVRVAGNVPVIAVGGIGVTRAGVAVRAGAWGVAVIREVIQAEEPGYVVAALVAAAEKA